MFESDKGSYQTDNGKAEWRSTFGERTASQQNGGEAFCDLVESAGIKGVRPGEQETHWGWGILRP